MGDHRWGSSGDLPAIDQAGSDSSLPRAPSRTWEPSSYESPYQEEKTTTDQKIASFRKSMSLPSFFLDMPYEDVQDATADHPIDEAYAVGLSIDDDPLV